MAETVMPVVGACRRRCTVVLTASVIAVYVVIGVVAFWPVLPGSSARLFNGGADASETVWFLGWVAHALAHGSNPFFSHAILVPDGVNLAQNTSVPLLSALVAPITLAFGPVSSANLLMVLAMPVSASAAFIVLRKWQLWGPAAALGGLIYGFSPYMVGQGLGHLQLVFVPLPPFIALTVASILHKRGSPIRLGVNLGFLVAAQFLIGPEVLVTVAILTAIALICAGIGHLAGLVDTVLASLVPFGITFAVAAVLVAYPLWMMLFGPQHFVGAVWGNPNPYHNDLLSFVVPGPLQRVPLGMRALGIRLLGRSNAAESGGYIGIPLLVLAAGLALRSRRSARMQLALLLMAVAALLSLGPHLAIDGHLTHIPLPGLILTKLPLLDNVLASRISFEVDACLAAVVAFGLDDLRWVPLRARTARRADRRPAGILLALVTAILVVTQLPQWPYMSGPAPLLPAQVRRAVPPEDPIAITYPYGGALGTGGAPMAWQAEDGFNFRLLGGYALHPGPTGRPSVWPDPMTPPGLQRFLEAERLPSVFGPPLPINSDLVATTRESLANYHVRLVLVDRSTRNSGPVVELFTRALGPPQRSVGNFMVWANRKGSP
ncbi:MAG: hypothetical protein WAV54_07705 [Acidimicrobiales bacterium]